MAKALEATEILAQMVKQRQSVNPCWISTPLLYADQLAGIAERLSEQELQSFLELGVKILSACEAGLVNQKNDAQSCNVDLVSIRNEADMFIERLMK